MGYKPIANLLADWREARKRMEELSGKMPRIMGAESVKVVKDNFRLQGYDSGTGVRKWRKRSEATDKNYERRAGGVKGSVYQADNEILMQSRNLFNSQKYVAIGNKVEIGSDATLVPYAQKMNEGGPGHWGKNPTNTPARQFIPKFNQGPNLKILKAIKEKLKFERDKALEKFKK